MENNLLKIPLNITGLELDQYFLKHYNTLIGIDEVGRGAIAGPLLCCALSLTQKGLLIQGLNDSKKLTPKKRESLFSEIVEKSHFISIGIAFPFEIDVINIYNATMLAMKRALDGTPINILNQKPAVIIDAMKLTHPLAHCYPIIKADEKSPTVMASSIIAKVIRDFLMGVYSKYYPYYGFEQHKGYGTALHKEKFKELGNCDLHRASFRF